MAAGSLRIMARRHCRHRYNEVIVERKTRQARQILGNMFIRVPDWLMGIFGERVVTRAEAIEMWGFIGGLVSCPYLPWLQG